MCCGAVARCASYGECGAVARCASYGECGAVAIGVRLMVSVEQWL